MRYGDLSNIRIKGVGSGKLVIVILFNGVDMNFRMFVLWCLRSVLRFPSDIEISVRLPYRSNL